MTVREPFELEALRKAGKAVATALRAMQQSLEPGITTLELDAIGGKVLAEYGAVSAPIKDYGFPGQTCISVNEEVAHGIPGSRRIQRGDLINFDVSACLDGFYADTGASLLFQSEDRDLLRLCHCSRRALSQALKAARAGNRINLVGKAIETFVSTGSRFAEEMDDGWTLVTPDGSYVAQYEHTVVVTDGEPLIMTQV
jgi:methionyl aminopeptidase